MSRTAELDESRLTTTLTGNTLELPSTPPEMVEALRYDRELLGREALVWQQWGRYMALLAMLALALAFGDDARAKLLPLALTALAYGTCVAVTSRIISRSAVMHEYRVPALLVTADIIALATLIWLTSKPGEMGRILMGAILVVQLAVFFFGRRLGTYAALLAALAYLWTTRVAPNSHVIPDPSIPHVLYSLGVFGLVCAVLITAYGNFRARMTRLRLFCKLVEEGDLTPSFAPGVDTRPDDLTLLARSFDAMRTRLAEQIGTDSLTGCLNRRALETRLRIEWRQAKRRSATIAVLAIDLDRFKLINDSHGHPFGDVVLKEVARIMRDTARDTDVVARVGGDEFVIVLPDTGWQGALTFAERLRRRVDEFDFGAPRSAGPITISLGVALARGNDPVSPELLLQEADRSLYKAKSGGRNRIFA